MDKCACSHTDTDNTAGSADMQNTCALDKKIGDVNGDRIYDTVYLIGKMKEDQFYENLKVMVQDGKTMQWFPILLYPNFDMAFNPWLFLGSFTGAGADEIMINMPIGGSGALTYYYVISFINNSANVLLGPEQFLALTRPLRYQVIYQDCYRVLVKSVTLNQSYILDVSDRKEAYEGTIYDENGMLLKPQTGFVIYQPHLCPVRFDGSQPYRLMAQQDIAGTSHADSLGSIITYWTYSGDAGTWVLDPETFFVML